MPGSIKNYFLPKLRDISDDITFQKYRYSLFVVEPKFFFNFLSGNIGLELDPELEPKINNFDSTTLFKFDWTLSLS